MNSGTSWLLGSGYPWHADQAPARPPAVPPDVVAHAHEGLSLAACPDGPLGLDAADGSLGRITLPRTVAVEADMGMVFVLAENGSRVLRYDPVRMTLEPLPHVGLESLPAGAEPLQEPRRFRAAANIAALHGELHVADPQAHRVQVFSLPALALLRVHGGLGTALDVAASARAVYVLDAAAGRVWCSVPGRDALALLVERPDRAGAWDRLAVDGEERLYLRRCQAGRASELDVFASTGGPGLWPQIEQVQHAARLAGRFPAPPVTTDRPGEFVLAPSLRDPCGLRRPFAAGVAFWTVGGFLYVADPARRTLEVLLEDGRLRHRWGPFDAQGQPVGAADPQAWMPADVAALGGRALILDARHLAVHVHGPGDALPRRLFGASVDAQQRWRRIALDEDGSVLLWDGIAAEVERFGLDGQALGALTRSQAGPRFARPKDVPSPRAPDEPLRLTPHGVVRRPADRAATWPGVDTYRTEGVWTSPWLDSSLYDCAWHLAELTLARMPSSAGVELAVRTHNAPAERGTAALARDGAGHSGEWTALPPLRAPLQPDPDPNAPSTFEHVLLLTCPPGRYLQLRVRLSGDGRDTPRLLRVRLRFPRDSWLQYLPAVYAAPPAQREFLDRLLSLVQTTWSSIEQGLETFDRHLDPDAAPDQSLPWLAAWLDLKLEGRWTAEQNRRLLRAMPTLRAQWGTVEGLRRWVRVVLASLCSLPEHELEQLGVPALVEGFVDRRRVYGVDQDRTLKGAQTLWSPAVERRFQVGVFDRVGEIELVSPGEPALDPFSHYAHRVRIHVPAALVCSAEDEALLRRAIDAHKPAHASCELVLVEPRLCIGQQSTLDLDTVLGEPVPWVLPGPPTDEPSSRAPHGRLGIDTTLAGTRPGVDALERRLA